MAKRPRAPRLDKYETFKAASGWYLAAWRDHRNLTLDELAAEAETTKGFISDLETGTEDKKGNRRRFNRDLVEKLAKVLGTSGGKLIDVNPFTMDEKLTLIEGYYEQMDEEDRATAVRLIEALAKTGTLG